ncbi:hypothetical protein M011DRAFT_473331 [Sporormia fimetaria CBS 119925]|uniref:Septin-type G domain-containing protein n=2 Tax=leotiomyceta TaxID=716546 RepID=A0A6A6VPD0_9PLEO|nr:hypothetical protein M011DRAFT_473331 [Sporormia fimetaria CBS 119925]
MADSQTQSIFGVESLADTLESSFGDSTIMEPDTERPAAREEAHKDDPRPNTKMPHTASPTQTRSPPASPPRSRKAALSERNATSPLSPSTIETHFLPQHLKIASTPRSASLQSFRMSDVGSELTESVSQDLTSSDDGDNGDGGDEQGGTESFPQLVMPSIQMPTRRPFTTKGKAMGKLKVLFAGGRGTGKTSLIRSIVQLCEDIVHVDPLSPSQSVFPTTTPRPSKNRKRKCDSSSTARLTEIHASTKAYPHWWTEVDEVRGRRRRSSTTEAVLERNITFVDTPGFGASASCEEEQSRVVDYVESLLHQNASLATMEDSDVLGVISGNGGVQVDVVFYLLNSEHDISKDITFMQRLSTLTNVIPIISKADTVTASEIVAIKTSILARLQTSSVKPFFFGKPVEDALLTVQGLPIVASSADAATTSTPESKQYPFNMPTYPYAISTAPGTDLETMDASLLMSSGYVQPLLPSELATLVTQVFDPESMAWLRHSAARRFLAWKRRMGMLDHSSILRKLQHSAYTSRPPGSSAGLEGSHMSGSASLLSATSPSGVLVPGPSSPFYLSTYNSSLRSTHTRGASPVGLHMTRYAQNFQGEQCLTDVRLAKWATDLQRSLRNEKEIYEEIHRAERAKWLLEKVGEEVREGNISMSERGRPRADWAVIRHGNEKDSARGGSPHGKPTWRDARDPLGLCDFGDGIKTRSIDNLHTNLQREEFLIHNDEGNFQLRQAPQQDAHAVQALRYVYLSPDETVRERIWMEDHSGLLNGETDWAATGRRSLHIQKHTCASCGYPAAKTRKFNWGEKAKRRKTTGSGRMRYLKTVTRKFSNGFRTGTPAGAKGPSTTSS